MTFDASCTARHSKDRPRLCSIGQFDLSGYRAYLQILAQNEDGSHKAWGLYLVRLTEGCLADDTVPTLLLDLDDVGPSLPKGRVRPLELLIYPRGEPVPQFQQRLKRSAWVALISGELPSTDDGIGHGALLGSVSFKVPLEGGRLEGRLPLVDCGR